MFVDGAPIHHHCVSDNDTCLSYERVEAVIFSVIPNEGTACRATPNSSAHSYRWDLFNSVMFACTVVTTIGTSAIYLCVYPGVMQYLKGDTVGCLGTTSWKRISLNCIVCNMAHDDVIKWKHFPRYWSFVRGIHRPVPELWYFLWCAPE